MTQIYLTGIELSQFRTFEHLQIELAPQPGVLVVHGSNGLGKSSLFDALEWTMTDNIDHFTSIDGYEKFGSYLCRWGDRSEPTSAAVTFSDGEKMVRQLANCKAKKSIVSGVADITEYLRLPDWEQPIEAVSRYLLLTHFLGQSTLSRLTHRKPAERLQILREVSQSASLQRFGVALHGPGQTRPARAFAMRIEQLQKDADQLADALDQEAQLWGGAEASGSIDDGEAATLTTNIMTVLNSAWLNLAGTRPPFIWEKMPEPDEIQVAIDRGAEIARERELAIAEARRILELGARHQKSLAATSAALAAGERDLTTATATAEAARKEGVRLRVVLDDATEALAAAREPQTNLIALREAAQALGIARGDRETAEHGLIQARAALGDAEERAQQGERRGQIEARLRTESAAVDEMLRSLRAALASGQQWLDLGETIRTTDNELTDLQRLHPRLDDQLDLASSTLTAAQSAQAATMEALQLTERSVGALSNAVSVVAAYLPHDSQDCPVCATHFNSADELAARARAAAERLAPLVLEQQKALSAAQAAVGSAAATVDRLQKIAERRASLTAQRTEYRTRQDQMLVSLGLKPDTQRAGVEAWLKNSRIQEVRLERSRRVKARWLLRLGSDRQAAALRSDALRARDAARIAEASAVRRLDDLKVAEQAAAERFSALAARLLPGDLPSDQAIEGAIGAASSALEASQKAYDQAAAAVSDHDLRSQPLQQAEASLKAQVTQLIADQSNAQVALADLSAQWLKAGWAEDDREESRIEEQASKLNHARQSIAEADAILRRLREGREAWSRQLAHRAAMERLRSLVDLAPNSVRDQVREAVSKKLENASRETAATVDAKSIASQASILIADAVDAFNAAYLDPLQKLTNRINQAILCDPRIGVDLRLQKSGIKQSASVEGEMPRNLNNVDPMLVHSEGQMAALAVSMLCAASLTYPWSRWKGLVLDDPLQHNDAIHAAAFADFVGNLVKAKGYQILISSHDLGQAEFLQRKFKSRDIPCAVLNLLGRGKDGVDWAFQPSGMAGPEAAALA